jgi:putative 2-oxoglutarate-Fe(II)-dependent oxygenase superfamily protein
MTRIAELTRTPSLKARIALFRQAVQAQPRSVALLCELAEALAEVGEEREAAEIFRQAYLLQPHLWAIALTNGGLSSADARKLRDYTRTLIANGVAYSPVIAALAVGEAHLGNRTEVQRLVDYDRLFRSYIMTPPDGYDQNTFSRALAAEIKSNLRFYDVPPNRAIRRGWRNSLTGSALPACSAWVRAVRREIDQYIASLAQVSDHPFPASRPGDYVLDAWAVVSNGESFHVSHMHPRAWVSGVFYVIRPPVSHDTENRRGWLEVGPPEERYGVSTAHGWGARTIAPEPGRLVLMPAYFFHGTHPMGVDEERICIAFDVMPIELAGEHPHKTSA